MPPPLSLPSSASKAALRRALGSRAPSVAMLDDGSGDGGASTTHGSIGLLVLLGCIRAGRCRCVDYYCTGESRIPSEFGLTMPGGMGWPPY